LTSKPSHEYKCHPIEFNGVANDRAVGLRAHMVYN
jgi:hypothetical protein